MMRIVQIDDPDFLPEEEPMNKVFDNNFENASDRDEQDLFCFPYLILRYYLEEKCNCK